MERRVFDDKRLKCVDCGGEFTFSGGERFYFWSRGLSTPKRCPECRLKRNLTIAPKGEGVHNA